MIRRLQRVLLLLTLLAGAGCRQSPTEPTLTSVGPRLMIEQTTIEAGAVDFARANEHAFQVRNGGDQPLRLTLLRKSCSCGDVRVPEMLAPGEEGRIVVRWAPIPGKVGPYVLSAEVEANDPHRPRLHLELKGQVEPLVRIAPEDLSYVDFGRLRPGQAATRELKVFSTKLEHFALDARIEGDRPGLKVQTTPLERGSLVGDARAASGYSLTLRSALLPPGYLRETLVLTVQAAGESPRRIELPVYGEVDNGVVQVTPAEVAFDRPRVTEADSKKALIQFLVPADGQKVEVLRCEPAFLSAGAQPLGRPGQWQLTVRLPANQSEAARYQADGFFEGRVLLKVSGMAEPMAVRVKWVRPER